MDNVYRQAFGEDVSSYLTSLRHLIGAADGTQYSIMPKSEFDELLKKDLASANRVLWTEILGRAHFAGASTIERNFCWIRGTCQAFESGNLLAFAASLRGFVEAAADSMYALQFAARTLAKHHKAILISLAGNEHGGFRRSPELEEILIHFSHARKLKKSEEAPESHFAKHSREYLNALSKVPLAVELYEELCQYTHPSAFSVLRYWHTDDDGRELRFFSKVDSDNVAELCVRYKECFPHLFLFAFNPALLVLAVLFEFPLSQFHVRQMKRYDLSEIPAWQDIRELMKCERPGR